MWLLGQVRELTDEVILQDTELQFDSKKYSGYVSIFLLLFAITEKNFLFWHGPRGLQIIASCVADK